MIKRAVIYMALKLNKSVLSLTADDYIENSLSDLLVEKGDAYEINLRYIICFATVLPAGRVEKQMQ
jgi:glucosamine-6-phosphate deaminase